MNLTKLIFPLFGLAVAAPAAAVTWSTTTSISLTSTGASIYCSTTTCNTSGSGLTGSVMTMRGYSTPNAQGSSNTSPSESGSWINAKLAIFGGSGVGISNTVQGSADQTSPQHAIDNYVVNDLLVVDFGSDNWDVTSFSLGWTCNMGNSSGTNCNAGSTVNVDAWVGGSGAINFNSVAFSGSGAAATLPGFTALSLTPDPSGAGTRTDSSSAVGRYLVISGSLSSYTDAFKVSGISANQITPPPPPTGVPLPGTAPLFMLGLLALGIAKRRRAEARKIA